MVSKLWYADLDCPSMVAAFIFARYGPAIKSAAFKNMALRCSQLKFSHLNFAFNAASMAAVTCSLVPL
jgi:hypothetical protein